MPELPEVETVRRQLEPNIVGKTIADVFCRRSKIVKNDEKFTDAMIGLTFTAVKRNAKLLQFEFDDSEVVMLCHLKMTGQLIFVDRDGMAGGGHSLTESDLKLPHKHTHVGFTLNDASKLYYNDMRMFGWLHRTTPSVQAEAVNKYGIEPGKPEYTEARFVEGFANRRTTVKALLLNQKVYAGLGNIYVDEACFRAGVRPDSIANKVPLEKIKLLHKTTEEVILESVKMGGTTFYNFVQTDGKRGNYYDVLKVFDRNGQACLECGTIIEKIKCAGRGTHFCPKCQKLYS